MKKTFLLLFAFCLFSTSILSAQNKQIQNPTSSDMEKAIEILNRAKNATQLEQAIRFFEVMAEDEGVDWLPAYYAAYSNALMSSMIGKPAIRDAHLNKAQKHIEEADLLSPDNVEIAVVQAYIYQMRIDVNPNVRTREYAPMVQVAFNKATKLDAENPRLYYLQAQSMLFSSNPNNNGVEKACPMVERANELFAAFKPESNVHPQWGKEMSEYMSIICARMNNR